MIKLYLYRISDFIQNNALESKADKRKIISKTAYCLMEKHASELCKQPAVIKKAENGKPYIDGCSYEISISHSDSVILLAISDKPIGVDVESPRIFSEHIKKRLFSAKERQYILDADNESNSATVLWTMREAVCKATGEGFTYWFFNCEMVDESLKPLIKYKIKDLSLNIKTYITEDKNIISVAAAADVDSVELFEHNL